MVSSNIFRAFAQALYDDDEQTLYRLAVHFPRLSDEDLYTIGYEIIKLYENDCESINFSKDWTICDVNMREYMMTSHAALHEIKQRNAWNASRILKSTDCQEQYKELLDAARGDNTMEEIVFEHLNM